MHYIIIPKLEIDETVRFHYILNIKKSNINDTNVNYINMSGKGSYDFGWMGSVAYKLSYKVPGKLCNPNED